MPHTNTIVPLWDWDKTRSLWKSLQDLTENPRVFLEHVRDSPKVDVFCALIKERVYGPFLFMETTITGIVYLDMLQQFLFPQLEEDDQEGRIHFQQGGAPPHCLGEVREYLSTRFPGRWIGRTSPIAWAPRSQELTHLEFFLWWFVKDQVFVSTLPANVVELRTRITAAVAEVKPEMLRSVWQEFDYRSITITNGNHNEPKLSAVKLCVFFYIMTVQNTVHVL
jgi:hypothetical protein